MASFRSQERQQVDCDRLARAPVARELQDGGAAQPLVGEQQRIRECGAAGCHRRVDGDAGQAPVTPGVRGLVGQRHQRGPAGDDRQAELFCDFIPEARGAGLRVGQAAGRHDQRGGGIRGRIRLHDEGVVFLDAPDGAPGLEGDAAGPALGEQQVDDAPGPVVAEQLAGGFLVVGDAVLLDQLDEIERGEPAERGGAEVRVVGHVILGVDPEIGEVAAPAPGYRNLPADRRSVIENEDLPAALPGRPGAHQARGTGADDHGVKSGFDRHAAILENFQGSHLDL